MLDRLRRGLGAEVKVLVKNSSWVFVANGFRTVLAFGKSVIIARGLGADLYGTYVLIFAFVVTIQELFNLNIGTAVIKFGADYRRADRPDKLVALVKASGVVCGGLAVVSILVVATASELAYDRVIGVPGLESYVVLYALVASTSFLDSISGGLLRLFYRFRLNSIVQMATALIDVTFMAAVLYLFPRQLEPFLIAMILAKLIDSGVINGAAVWEMWGEFKGSRRARIRLIQEDRKTIGAFVLSNSGSRTLKTLMDRGDVLLLGAFSSVQQVGLYDIAKKLAYTVLRFTDPLSSAIYPQLATLLAESRVREVIDMLRKVTLAFALPAIPCVVLAYLFGDVVLVQLYGREFGAASTLLTVHLVAAVTSGILFWGLPMVQSLNLMTTRFRVMAVAFVLGAGAGLLAAPVWGALGVAVVYAVSKIYISMDMVFSSTRRLSQI